MVSHYESNGFVQTSVYANMFNTTMQTVRKTLHAEGIHHRRPAKKPFLTDINKRNLLIFARDYLDYDWTYTMCSLSFEYFLM